ncbi:HD domain-containing protein [Micromonospora sp. WMMD975]|uniref:HD domain-containing protein n=1 Tax=Micromonospora sp. WMMD975 TaxID=3016087 RepID=UPI00249B0CCA|nr:HD domain-containing protein [Micromonospora sp. WMMD975]WFE35893.1 HDIG domain-containing protein [Micromonospora sp. WMMD975]
MAVPTDELIRALHERAAPTPEAFHLVWTHCRIVCEVAEHLLARHGAGLDAALVRAGSLLHDIGVYRLYGAGGRLDQENYVRHGVLGHALLRDAGLPESLGRFCSRHTGVGISREDVLRQRLPLPVADYTPTTGEEQLVMYADKFHSKTTPPTFVSAASYAAAVGRFGADKVVRFAALVERFGEPDLRALARAHRQPIV